MGFLLMRTVHSGRADSWRRNPAAAGFLPQTASSGRVARRFVGFLLVRTVHAAMAVRTPSVGFADSSLGEGALWWVSY